MSPFELHASQEHFGATDLCRSLRVLISLVSGLGHRPHSQFAFLTCVSFTTSESWASTYIMSFSGFLDMGSSIEIDDVKGDWKFEARLW